MFWNSSLEKEPLDFIFVYFFVFFEKREEKKKKWNEKFKKYNNVKYHESPKTTTSAPNEKTTNAKSFIYLFLFL